MIIRLQDVNQLLNEDGEQELNPQTLAEKTDKIFSMGVEDDEGIGFENDFVANLFYYLNNPAIHATTQEDLRRLNDSLQRGNNQLVHRIILSKEEYIEKYGSQRD